MSSFGNINILWWFQWLKNINGGLTHKNFWVLIGETAEFMMLLLVPGIIHDTKIMLSKLSKGMNRV